MQAILDSIFTFNSALFMHSEEIQFLFYSSDQLRTKEQQTGLGGPEIGLIVMAVVILLGTTIAIVFINRQFSRYILL